MSWQGQGAQELRASFGIRDGQPFVQELAARAASGRWTVLGKDLFPDFQVSTGKRRISPDAPEYFPGDLGHYHTDFAEIWTILRGQQSFAMEGLKPFVASEGDIVYAPAKRWHRIEAAGEGMSCRLAMTPYPAGNHLYQQ